MKPNEPQNQNLEQQPQSLPEPVLQPTTATASSESINIEPVAVAPAVFDQPVATASPFALSNPAADPVQTSMANQSINFIGGSLVAAGIANTIIAGILVLIPAPWSPVATPISLLLGLVLGVTGLGLIRKNKIAYIIFYITLVLIAAYFVYNSFYIFGLFTILPLLLAFGGLGEISVWVLLLQFGLYLLLGIFFVVAGILMRGGNIRSQFRI